jgi:iron(III) transport system substrate-binding protein
MAALRAAIDFIAAESSAAAPRARSLRVLCAFVVLFTFSTVAAQAADDWPAVITAAKQEAKVVVYNSAIDAPYYRAVIKSFEATYGIAVQTLDARASEIVERVRTEQAAGRFLGDVEQHGWTTLANQNRDGQLQPYGSLPNTANLAPPFAADAFRVPCFTQAYGILVNTRLVKPEDEPRSWHDLLDARWQGKILADDFRAIGGGQVLFFATYQAFGAAFHDRLKAQALVFSRDIRNDERRVARGEYPLYLPELIAFSRDLKGLPVKLMLPEEGSPYVGINFAMLRNAPHPNAARLFMNHFLEPDSQLLYANGAQIPVVGGVVERADPEVRKLISPKLLGTTSPELQAPMLSLATQIYK